MCSSTDAAIYLAQRFSREWNGFGFFDLQRLLYLAQGWHIASRQSLLFADKIEAHGPAPLTRSVIGPVPIDEMLPLPRLTPDAEHYLRQFSKIFLAADRDAMRRQVEHERGAWKRTFEIRGDGATIPPRLMLTSFRFILSEFKAGDKADRKLMRVCRGLSKV